MTQAYSDPERENDPYALPDVEVFQMLASEFEDADPDTWMYDAMQVDADPRHHAGWYWWSCFPGCLPDSDPIGPFDTEEDALADAQDQF